MELLVKQTPIAIENVNSLALNIKQMLSAWSPKPHTPCPSAITRFYFATDAVIS